MAHADLPPSPVVPTIDLQADGVQHGHLRLPYSRDDSAWGSVMIPICMIANGEGPTALLVGANHGDEYEGPIALYELARTLRPEDVTGRVIVLPALNYPAFEAGTRTSPIDKGNLNRSFPGRPDGTPTQKIADFVTRALVPLADIVLDIHSGGKTLDFVPFAAAHRLPDARQEAACKAAVEAFGAPYSMTMLEIDAVGMLDTTVEEMGKTFVTTELGGGGTASARTIAIARQGVRDLLVHAGVMRGTVERRETRWLDMPSGDCFSFAEEGGLIAFRVDLGEPVRAGDVICEIAPIGRTGAAPHAIRAAMDGILAARHVPGLVKPGDCAAVVAQIVG